MTKPSSVRLLRKLYGGNILDRIAANEITQLQNATRPVRVAELSELATDLGQVTAGSFIAPASGVTTSEPTDSAFTGAAMGGNGWEFNNVTWNFVGVLLGVLQAGFNNLGQFLAAGGEYTIDADGTLSNGLTFLHRFEATYGGITRQAYFGMFIPDGETQPAFRIYYNEPASSNLILNGSFESGDETSWTDTNTSWSVAADATYGYAAQHDNTDTGCPPTFTQAIAVSASTLYLFTFASKMASGDFPPNVSLIWKDAGSVVLRTDTAIGSDASAWVEKSGAYTSPSTAATVTISVHPGEIFTDCYVSGFELFELTAFSAMDFHDGKIIVDAVPGKPVNLFGLPQSAMSFAQEFVYSATATTTQNANQRFAFFRGPTAANAANADTIDLSFVVAAGTYTLTIIGVKDDDCGITDGYIDGSGSTEWTGDDWYNALAISYNATFNHTVTFTTGGRHTLQLKVNGKNAASSDYAVRLSAVYLTPVSHSVEA